MRTRSQGTTLIELMTALVILGILLAIAAPSFRRFTLESRTTAATNDLVSALNLARSEALRRSANAVVCASDNQSSCNSSDWADGWIVFADPNANGSADADELLRVWPAVDGGLTVTASADSVTYNGMGMRQLPAAANLEFEVEMPACTGNRAGLTEVLISGTIRSRKVACGS